VPVPSVRAALPAVTAQVIVDRDADVVTTTRLTFGMQRCIGCSIELAAPVAVTAVREFLTHDRSLHEVIFCRYSPADLAVYERVVAGADA